MISRLRLNRGPRCRRRGVAAVEFAVLLPFLATVFLIGTDWCRIFYAATTLTDSARSGALAASGIAYLEYGLDDSERVARGKAEAVKDGSTLNPPLQQSHVTVTTQGNYVTVTVNYTYQTRTGMMGFGSNWPITRSVRMPIIPQE